MLTRAVVRRRRPESSVRWVNTDLSTTTAQSFIDPHSGQYHLIPLDNRLIMS